MNARRILHTLFTGLLAVWALASCIDDELVKNNNVVEGVPITVTMKLAGAPTADVTVETRASGNDLSTLSNLTIYVYDGNGKYQQTVSTLDKTLTIESGPTGTADVTYRVRFSTTSGTKKLLAVGNSTSSVWSEANNINVSTMNFEELKKHLANLNIPLNQDGEFSRPATITADGQMMITGKNEGIQFGTNGTVVGWGESDNDIAVKMKRIMAHVTFNITPPKDGNAKGTFIPTSYKVYNVPTKACLVNMDDDNTIVAGEGAVGFNHFAATTINPAINDVYSFDFYMPENIYDEKSDVNDYKVRDVWTKNSEELLGKKWTNAPQTSTFVVISGTYSGNSTVDDNGIENSGNHAVTGNVQYTIHLGDFSDLTGELGNYSVARNVSYTYNVSVEGIDKIVVEALTNKEDQPGAEGQIFTYDGSTYSYELDAHYEQLFLEYNLSSIASAVQQILGPYDSSMEDASINKAIADNLILVIQSEAMDYTHDGEDYTVQNKRGTLRPYQIYADAVQNGQDPTVAKNNVWKGSGSGITPTGGFDYQWIEFWPQTNSTELAAYPGVSEWSCASSLTDAEKKSVYGTPRGDTDRLKDVYDVIVAMGKAVKSIYKTGSVSTTDETPNTDGICITQDGNSFVTRFTAFVNEYYYYEHPLTHAEVPSWDVFVNKIPREMIIAMSSKISSDGNSSYSQVYSYITQRSMETFYNSRATAINGFGIETYNETPLTEKGVNFTFGKNIKSGLSDTDGRSNQIDLIDGNDEWEYYISTVNNGWFNSTNTNHKEHKLSIDAYSDDFDQRGAYAACLSRNRDLNGDGIIDNSEVRWFLPSVNEYLRIGIGSSALSNAAQLYIGNKASLDDDIWYTGVNQTGDKNYVTEENLADGTLFYTSSIDDHRTFWAVEKGSYGKDQQPWTANNSPKPIRCIRVLPTNITSVNAKSDATYERIDNDPSKLITLKFKGRLVDRLYRNGVYTSVLSRHDEDGEPNFYSEGIFVASKNVKQTNWWGDETNTDATFSLSEIIGYDSNGNMSSRTNPCANYSEGSYGKGSGWRVPNLVELMAMNAEGLVDVNTTCCTAFSRQKVRYGFFINEAKMISCPGSKGSGDLTSESYKIRCVRDVPTGYFD